MTADARRRLRADLLLLLITLFWGSTFVMVKDAVADYPVFPFLALRFALATGALLVIGGRRLRTLGWRGIGAGAVIGVFLFGGFALQTLGLQHTTASKAGFITGLSVVLVPVLATIILRMPPRAGPAVGVALATAGLALLSLDGALRLKAGDLLVLGCAACFALQLIAIAALAPGRDAIALTIVQTTVVTLASAAIAGAMHLTGAQPWPAPGGATWFAAGFTGILATAVAFGVLTALQPQTTPTHAALILTAEPVFAAIFGMLLQGDRLAARGWAGAALILSGMLAGEIRWTERTATFLSRFLSPHYVTGAFLVALGLGDPGGWRRGVAWSTAVGAPILVGGLLLMRRELRRGAISDWHISDRHERLRPVPILASLVATGAPVVAVWLLRGPRLLLAAGVAALAVVLVNLLVTLRWKISQHVSTVALCATMLTAALGMAAAPTLLLVPLVAWARVRVGAHTPLQTAAGAASGALVALGAMRLLGVA